MNKVLCYLILISAISTIVTASENYNKGDKKMADLIINEDFSGNTRAYYEGRGWYDGTGSIGTGYQFEQDVTLNKNVMLATWSNGSNGEPNGGSGWRYPITAEQGANGVSLYAIIKYHDVIGIAGNCHGMHRFGQGWGRYNPGNANGQILIDPGRRGSSEQMRSGGWANTERMLFWNWTAPERAETDLSHTNYLNDDAWYEIRAYIKPSNPQGSANAHMVLDYRLHGTNDWIRLSDLHNFNLVTSTSGDITQFMIGPYMHNNARTTSRMYLGNVRLYVGDAISDGTIDNDIDDGEGTIPSKGPNITNISNKTTDTTAKITWDTDVNSNSVVDYGITDTRGTLVRGNDNTQTHVVEITGLAPETTYYYRLSSRDNNGNTTLIPDNRTFETKATDVVEPPIGFSPVITNPQLGQVLMYDGANWINVDTTKLLDKKIEEILSRTILVVKS